MIILAKKLYLKKMEVSATRWGIEPWSPGWQQLIVTTMPLMNAYVAYIKIFIIMIVV